MDTEGKTWKGFMAKLYGFGAAIVIIGALFKIQHWNFFFPFQAGFLLTVGLFTEAIIFFFSAFEPLHETYDWSLVYPELAGLPIDEEPEKQESKNISTTQHLDLMLEEAKIGPELLNSLGEGLKNLSTTANNMNSISDASLATNEFVSTMKGASKSVETLSKTYENASETIHSSNDNLKMSYQKATEALGALNLAAEDGKTYAKQVNNVSSSLAALNSLYEMQLKKANEQFESSSKMFSGVGELVENLSGSLNDTKRYKEEISRLSVNLEALNNVYGNMLTAMNVKSPSK